MSGGPILRGHWGALICLFMAGVCFDKIEVVDRFTSATLSRDGWTWWPTDTPWLLAAVALSVVGKLSLDMYGRNAWLTWAPPGETWNGLTKADCNRVPLIRRPRWLTWSD